ncbi:cell envelope biogenesis protein TolA, partial [Xanthomonas citri pv. citri]|nr:cell envelope biogenesis protein TolA [Xanthomonas citri pv. citri]
FQYSYTKDPLYRQYEQNYLQNAHNASADAAAQAAALTGGYGSSYAASVAQQAYQQQIGALSSAIPTLYSLALDTYTSGGNELVSQL